MLSNTHIHIHILSLAHTQTDGYSKLSLVLILLFVFGEYFLSLPRYAKYARLAQFSHRFSWLAAHIFYDILRFSMCFFFVCYVVRVFREVGIIELSARLAAKAEIWRCCLLFCLGCCCCTQRGLLFAFRL